MNIGPKLVGTLIVTIILQSLVAVVGRGPDARAAEPDSPLPALKAVSPWPVGVAISETQMEGVKGELVASTFGQITPENAMKPAYIWRDPSVTDWRGWDWAAADRYVDFAVANGLRVYAHTLIWHQQMPEWFYQRADGSPFWDSATASCSVVSDSDRELMRWRIRTYIDGFAEHFRTTYGEFGTSGNPIVAVDVVNEAIEDTPDHFRRDENPLYCVLGTEYLDVALVAADEAFRNASGARAVRLFINDFNTEWEWKSDDQLAVVRDLVQRGVPLDGVGHQLHVSLRDHEALLRPENLPRTMRKIDDLGLMQAVTELDVGIGDPPIPDDQLPGLLVEQGEMYHDLFALFRDHDLFSVSLWGLDDTQTWRTGTFPLLFGADLSAKPALRGALEQRPVITRDLPSDVNVSVGERVELAIAQVGYPTSTITWQQRRTAAASWTTLDSHAGTSLEFIAASSDDGTQLRAVVSNAEGSVTSTETRVAVRQASTFISASQRHTVSFGRPLTVPVTVEGADDGELRATLGSWASTTPVTAGGRAVIRVPARTALPGRAALHLQFLGTPDSAPSHGRLGIAVRRAESAVTIRAPRAASPGKRVVVRVAVRAPGVPIAGRVRITLGGRERTVALTARGRASIRVRLPRRTGSVPVTATYLGDTVAKPSSAQVTVRTGR